MRQPLETWKSDAGSRLWLSMLVAAMEHARRPDFCHGEIDGEIDASVRKLRTQLALPASLGLHGTSASRLRH